MIQQTVYFFGKFKPRCTMQVKRVMLISNPILRAVVLPSVLHLYQQILFVVQFRYVHIQYHLYLRV